jgi:hypothetical protein
MSTDEVGTTGTATVDAALQGIRDTLEADGYSLEWSVEEPDLIGIRVVAGAEACADCLVPPEIMRTIVSNALSETPYGVGSITLPAEHP